jgi:dCMP deaminase
MPRESWDNSFMGQAHSISKRSTCLVTKSGAILVKKNLAIGQGYSGAPKGMPHCYEVINMCVKGYRVDFGHIDPLSYHPCRGIPAEMNAIHSAPSFKDIEGATLYIYNEDRATGNVVEKELKESSKNYLMNLGLEKVIMASPFNDSSSDEVPFEIEGKKALLKTYYVRDWAKNSSLQIADYVRKFLEKREKK